MKTINKTLWKSDGGADLISWTPGESGAAVLAVHLSETGLREMAEACIEAAELMRGPAAFDKDGIGVFVKRSERLRAEGVPAAEPKTLSDFYEKLQR